jgi:hypothetical protein
MNADQVVLVALDRDEADALSCQSEKSGDVAKWLDGRKKVRAALRRDPDELVEQMARAIEPWAWAKIYDNDHRLDPKRARSLDQARAVLAALGGPNE